MPVKVFGPCGSLNIELYVNQWISEVSPNITQMSQSENDGGGVTLTILYEKSTIKNLTESIVSI